MSRSYDVVVIGAGINGAGVAQAAAIAENVMHIVNGTLPGRSKVAYTATLKLGVR